MTDSKENNGNVLVMDFTGVYDFESFTQKNSCQWLNCRKVSGTDCYCDEEAAKTLKSMISRFPVQGIHFMDSGNYHYVTKFWTDRIHHPFSLIVFDHHPDMQPPLFEGLLSCGSWVKEVADTNPYLQKVIIIGASDALIKAIPDTYHDKIVFYSETSLQHEETWKHFAQIHLNEPVYISIDKDVLNTQAAITNWNQGSLSLSELKKLLGAILKREQVIGIDVCGECSPASDILEEETNAQVNNRTNEAILRLCEAAENQHSA